MVLMHSNNLYPIILQQRPCTNMSPDWIQQSDLVLRWPCLFWSKIANLVKNRNFDEKLQIQPKWKVLSKMKILFKNRNFSQTILVKNRAKSRKFSQLKIIKKKNPNFDQKSKVFSKIKNCGQKWEVWSKIEILVINRNFGQTSKFCAKIENLGKNPDSGQQSKVISKIKKIVKYRTFLQNYYFLFIKYLDLFCSSKFGKIIYLTPPRPGASWWITTLYPSMGAKKPKSNTTQQKHTHVLLTSSFSCCMGINTLIQCLSSVKNIVKNRKNVTKRNVETHLFYGFYKTIT